MESNHMAPRTLTLLIGAAIVAAACILIFSTRPANEALTTEAEAPAEIEVRPKVADLTPPAMKRTSATAERAGNSPRVTDPYAGRDLHTLYGRVTDAHSKEPVGFFTAHAALVTDGDIEYLSRSNRYAQPFSNKYGAFTFRGKEAGQYNVLIQVTGYQDEILSDVTLPMEEGSQFDVEVSRGAWIQAECVNTDGDGLGGIEIRLVPVRLDNPNEKPPRIQLRRTDDYGKVLFSNLPTGVYHVELLNKALHPNPSPDYHLGPQGNFPVQFVVNTANTLTVNLEDEDGGPVAHAHLRMFSTGEDRLIFRLETDRSGSAKQEFVPKGDYTYKIWKRGYYRKSGTIVISSVTGEVDKTIVMRVDPTNGEQERNPTMKQLERLKAGEDPADVFDTSSDG